MKKKILILKNDRTGDLFVSLLAINKILNKHLDDDILIYLSKINQKFSFIFPNIKKKVLSMNLTFVEKIKIFLYFITNEIDTVYILTPKNFYYYLPFFFKKTKFVGITIKSKKNRPNNFFLKYLNKYSVIDRINIKPRKSSYELQQELVDLDKDYKILNYLNENSKSNHNFKFPKKYIYFHYKQKMFDELLNWTLNDVNNLIKFLSDKFDNILFSSEINNNIVDKHFSHHFNTFNFSDNKEYFINNKNIYFLKNIDGYDLFKAVKGSAKIVAPEGIISHIGYFLKKDILALMHFNLNNRQDFINQIISCKEWFPPNNYNYIVLKKDFDKSIIKLKKRL